jgi:ribosomal peptide maturation radical SAM protein 1
VLNISLINMPFASVTRPSIGMTQLKSVLEEQFGDQVSVEILYPNHDFVPYMGQQFYQRLSDSMEHHATGLGDWIFRQAAFPEAKDNTEEYFKRCYPHKNERFQRLKAHVQEKRKGLEDFLDKLIDKYHLYEADIVGLSSTFAQNVASFAMARKLKERNPRVITLLGGANCEASMGREIAREVPQIDYVFSGPSLKSLSTFVGHVLAGTTSKCDQINGVFSKANCNLKKNGLVVLGDAQPVADIGDDLHINTKINLKYEPFLQLYQKNFGPSAPKPALLVETSRGCWWGERAHCTFCGLNGGTMNYRAMNPELAVEQFQSIFQYAPNFSMLECVDNIMPKSYITDVLPLLKTPPDTHIFYEVKADLSEEDIAVLAQAGVRCIQPGIEALATSTLKLMKKGTSVFQNLNLLKSCIMHDVRPSWNLLLGFPGEGEDVYKKYVEVLPHLTHLFPPSGAFPVRFDRFSPYFVKADQYKLDLRPVDFYELTYPFSEESLKNLAYYFMDRNYRADYITVMIKWIGKIRERVNHWLELWYQEDRAFQPQLYFKDEGQSTVILDSRTGHDVEYDAGREGKLVLESLNKRKDMADLAADLKHVPDLDVRQQVALLQERGFIFEEGGRYFNLVLPRKPAPMTVR